MASDDTMTIHSSMHEDDYDVDYVNDEDDHQNHPLNLSRLSLCTTSFVDDEDDDDAVGLGAGEMGMYISRLSIEGSDGDADEELSADDKEEKGISGMSWDSDKEPGCFSLPATPPHRRGRRGSVNEVKEYASENEAQLHKGGLGRSRMWKNPRRRMVRESWLERAWEKKSYKAVDEDMEQFNNSNHSGESECLLITRPKGGKRSLCMDMEEVKACRDLGFELEHERMLEIPSRFSMSGSTVDTSSGGNSPIANWRISSPGDDPRDVKARIKVWAQAVALASASRHTS